MDITGLTGVNEAQRAALLSLGAIEQAPTPAAPAAPATDPTPVAVAALTALGLHRQPNQEVLEALIAYLQTRRLLLVLDNCEHVVAACAALATPLLASCPELRILATSQQALGIADEMVCRVDTFAPPPPLRARQPRSSCGCWDNPTRWRCSCSGHRPCSHTSP